MPFNKDPPKQADYDDNMDLDVCLCCGTYYGTTPTLVELWHKSFNYREGAVMPQLCHKCMKDN